MFGFRGLSRASGFINIVQNFIGFIYEIIGNHIVEVRVIIPIEPGVSTHSDLHQRGRSSIPDLAND